jgi:hypothetical protein
MKGYGIYQSLELKNKFMYKYLLKNKSGEVINTTRQDSLDLAIEYFSKMKLISKKDIFRIYIIEKV